MMWLWRYRRNTVMQSLYAQRAGNYATMNQGLSEQQMDIFYRRLGLRSLGRPSGRNVRHALGWSPVIVTSIRQTFGHAMLVVGHNGGRYTIVNPCLVQTVDFGPQGVNTCTAGTRSMSDTVIEADLGQYIWYW
jgi:hypothetical protein